MTNHVTSYWGSDGSARQFQISMPVDPDFARRPPQGRPSCPPASTCRPTKQSWQHRLFRRRLSRKTYEKWAKWELGRTLENPGFSLLLIPMRYILIKQQPTARVSPALHSTTHNTPYSSKSTGHIFEWSREQAAGQQLRSIWALYYL